MEASAEARSTVENTMAPPEGGGKEETLVSTTWEFTMPAANVTLTGETAQMKTNYTFVTEPEGLESHITAPNETQRGQWSGNQPLSLTVDDSFDDKVYNHVYKQEKTLKNLKISTFFSV